MGWENDPIVGARPKWQTDPIIDAAPVMLAAVAATPAIELGAGAPVPQVLQPSANPYSAGFYPLGRKYTVGDEATFRESDLLTGIEKRVYTQRVTRVDAEADRVEINGGDDVWDLMGNAIKAGTSVFDVPRQFSPAEFQVGKKWTAAFRGTENGLSRSVYYELHIVGSETVNVPAGSLQTFMVEGRGLNSLGFQRQVRLWLVPGLNFPVREEQVGRSRQSALVRTERHELVSLRQQEVGL
jgi:hypothetical protein